MTQLWHCSSSFHEHGSSSGALGFHECCSGLSFFMAAASGRFHTLISKLSWSVAYLCKMEPMAKCKCAPFLIISMPNIATIFTKDQLRKCFKTENMYFLFVAPFQ